MKFYAPDLSWDQLANRLIEVCREHAANARPGYPAFLITPDQYIEFFTWYSTKWPELTAPDLSKGHLYGVKCVVGELPE